MAGIGMTHKYFGSCGDNKEGLKALSPRDIVLLYVRGTGIYATGIRMNGG